MEVINYETGWKGTWNEGQLNTQFTVYYESFKDYQANFAEVVGAITFPTNRTAETESHLWGIELSGQARFERVSLDFGLAFLESELGTFSDVQDPFRTPPNNVVNLSGAKSPFSPELTGNFGIAYDFKFNGYTLTPRADVSHISETQGALWDSPMVTLPERTLINAQLSLAPESAKWSAVAWGTNVTDKHYIAGIQNNATLFYAGPPGQFGIRVRYNF
jgi:iron complex outermembrane receptor protein